MRRVLTAAAVAAVALGAAPAARALPATPGRGTEGAATLAGSITGLSVVPSDGKAEVIVSLSGAVDIDDFTLTGPNRVVVDIKGATLGRGARGYDRMARGGITNVRLSQYRAGVVRLVLDLDGAQPYTVSQDANGVHVSVDGSGDFAAWHSDATAPASVVADAAAVTRPAAPAPTAQQHGGDLPFSQVKSARQTASEPKVLQQRTPQPRITVTYQDADIRDVLAAFAAFSGRTIVVGRDIQGTVTAEIRDQPWDVALQAILGSQGLAAAEDANGIITVDSYKNILSKQASEPLVTQLVSLNYANAASLAPTARTLLSKDCAQGGAAPGANAEASGACMVRGSIMSDSATNALLITEVPSRINNVIGYIRDLDVRTPQVAIKAKIIFVNRTNLEDIGLTYDLGRGTDQFFSQLVKRTDPSTLKPVDTNGDGVPDALGGGSPFAGDRIALGGRAFSAIANANNRVPNAALSLIYSATIGRYQLTTFLDALQETRLADVQAEPTIVTLDNRRAEILVGQEVPLRTVDYQSAGQSGGAQGGNQARATVTLKEVGIILGVTPHITNNRQVKLEVHAENSDAQLASSDVGLIFNKQRADNQLLVGDGETAVIGGLTVTTVSKLKTGIPILLDLPIIGRLFGRTSTQESKRDLLILVTPHIVDDGERVGGSPR